MLRNRFFTSLYFIILSGLIASLLIAGKFKPDESFEAYTQNIPDSKASFGMVPIPAGTFKMGNAKGNPDEMPAHDVQISAFWMGTHEITWDIFELFLDKNYELAIAEKPLPSQVDGLTRPSIPYLDMTAGMGKEGKPAIGMTQYGALQFCKWLYLKTGNFYRLPTEAEWEYACRAGTETTYSFGNNEKDLGNYAWYSANSGGSTKPIGQKKPNPWGLYDIHGNVMEWTSDQYDAVVYKNRASQTVKDPLVPITKLYPGSIRGGHYKSPAAELRSSQRIPSKAEWKRIDPQIPKSKWWFPEAPFLGIRVVRPLNPPSPEEIMAYYNKTPIADY